MTAPLTLDEALTALKSPVLTRVREGLSETPPDGEKMLTYYATLLTNDTPVMWYDVELAKIITCLPTVTAYHEVGVGIGVLPLLLGLLGHKAVAIDAIAKRCEVGTLIRSDLAAHYPGLAANVTFACGTAPAIFNQLPTQGALCLSTNLGATREPSVIAAYLSDVAAHYSGYVFDACLLWGIRRQRSEIDTFLAQTSRDLGRIPQKVYEGPHFAEYYYVHLR
jgi:hypothetical protein